MKTAPAFTSIAIASLAASTTASLTPADTAYDFFTAYVQEAYGAVGEIVLFEDDLWLTQTFNKYLAESETKLAEGKEKFDFYDAQLEEFFEKAAAHNPIYDDFQERYEAYELNPVASISYSLKAFADVVFDTAEAATAELKNASLASWVSDQRKQLEKGVTAGQSPLVLTGKLDEFMNRFNVDEDANMWFFASLADVAISSSNKYNIPIEEDGSGSGEDD